MVINCPNCNLLQPKDQYCAQCGINMETWKPPTKPVWKKLISNWMFQLTALFLIIFAVVMRDNLTSGVKNNTADSLPPVSQNIARNDSANFAPSNNQRDASEAQDVNKKKQKKTEALKPGDNTESLNKKSETSTALEKVIEIEVMIINRRATDNLQQSAQKLDDTALITTATEGGNFLRTSRRGIKKVGSTSKSFQFNQPTEFFIGEEDIETGNNIGFYVVVTVQENSTVDGINAEVRFWNQLKLSGETSQPASYDVTLKQKAMLLILDPSVHDLEFSTEERNLFEASNKLKTLNNDSFVESISDIALVLKIK